MTQITKKKNILSILLFTVAIIAIFAAKMAAGSVNADVYTYTVTATELSFAESHSAGTGVQNVWESDDYWTLIRSKAEGNIAIVGNGKQGKALGIGFIMPEAGTVVSVDEWSWYFYMQQKNTTVYSQVFLDNKLVYPTGKQIVKHSRPADDMGYAPCYFNISSVKVNQGQLLLWTLDSNETDQRVDSVAFDYAVKFVPDDTESQYYNNGDGVVWKFSEMYYMDTSSPNAAILKFYQVNIQETVTSDIIDNDDSDRIIDTGTYYNIDKTPLVFRSVNNNPNVTNCWEGGNDWTLVMSNSEGITGHGTNKHALALEFTFDEDGILNRNGDWNNYIWNKSGTNNPLFLMIHNNKKVETSILSVGGDGILVYYGYNEINVKAGDTITFIMDADSVEDAGTNISVQFNFSLIFVPADHNSTNFNDGNGIIYDSSQLYYTTDTTNSAILNYYEVGYSIDESNAEAERYNAIINLSELKKISDIEQGDLYFDTNHWTAEEENFCHIYNNSMHPATGYFPTVVFKAPENGKLFFSNVSYHSDDSKSDGINFGVFAKIREETYSLLGDKLWNTSLAKEVITLNLPSLELAEGDEVYFVLNPYKSNSFDSTSVTVELVYKVGTVEKRYSLKDDFSGKQLQDNFGYRWSKVYEDYSAIVVGEVVERAFESVDKVSADELIYSPTHNRWYSISYEYSAIEPSSMHPASGADIAVAVKFEEAGRIVFDEKSSVKMTEYGYVDDQDVTSDGVKFRIMLNNNIVYPLTGEWITLTNNNEVALGIEPLSVKAGDVLYFVINSNGKNNYDTLATNFIVHFAKDDSQYTRTYNLAKDFSGVQGENGWSYYEITFTKNTQDTTSDSTSDKDEPIINNGEDTSSEDNGCFAQIQTADFTVMFIALLITTFIIIKKRGESKSVL